MNEMNEKEYQSDVFDQQTWKKIFSLLWVHKKHIILLISFNICLAISDVIMPLLNRFALNEYVDKGTSAKSLPLFVIVYIILILIQCLCVYLFFLYASRIESNFGRDLRQLCFRKLQEQTFSYFDRTANGWLMARITSDTARLAEVLAWAAVDLVWGIFVMIGIGFVMFAINWQMALVVLAVVPLLWFISLYFQRRILKAQRKSRKANSKITAAFAEGINGAQTTKTLGIEKENYEEFQTKTRAMNKYSMRAVKLNAIFQPIVYLFSGIVIAGLLLVGGQQVVLQTIQFGTLAMFINYANLFFDPLKQIARVLSDIQMAQASAERVVSLLEEEIEIQDDPSVIDKYGTILNPKVEAYEPLLGDIDFNHVNFYYQPNEMILEDFNLHVKKGQMIALVGETGSGKSTIVNLLCRFYEPKSGTIDIDNKNYRERSVGWLHANIGYVLQAPNLFSGSILDNIRYGRPNASLEEVKEVAKLIHADTFINVMKDGYQSEVGEGGDRLSTGQKQLISFARAILSDPSIVILDEATSSIDTESEKAIQHAITKLLENRTSFVVAHRLSTIVDADIIVVLQHGRIVEQGTHQELLKQKGYYYELYTSQYIEDKEREIFSTK
ncbi:MAG: ABC transporter ATP-binding protein [Erysipelotrichaceae bacterium]